MLRLMAACGMGSMFLWISPPLRINLTERLMLGVRAMDMNAPYSYIGVGVVAVIVFLTSLVRGSQRREY
jgi:hypothetical protein